jgi:hypothetical protein
MRSDTANELRRLDDLGDLGNLGDLGDLGDVGDLGMGILGEESGEDSILALI